MKEFCICAAVRMPDGEVVRGHRHCHCYGVVRDRMGAFLSGGLGAEYDALRKKLIAAEQGFVTSTGRFVLREEAMIIQRESGRPSKYSRDGRYHGDSLFSEDLY